ncbi:MCPT3 protease, partial [Baryphthengus martii]|nr:MCPT3 protease [Baryphthengus martii]
YMAYLQGQNKICGGFLVDFNWVMTSAQCYDREILNITLGAHTIQRREKSQQIFQVQGYYPHPEFNKVTKKNDILLLKLKGRATSNNNVGVIDFEKTLSNKANDCSVAGWRDKAHGGTLQKANIALIDRLNCLNNDLGHNDNMICGNSSSAWVPGEGDYGDPLICKKKARGIFSYSKSKGLSYYTRIACYAKWIEATMK